MADLIGWCIPCQVAYEGMAEYEKHASGCGRDTRPVCTTHGAGCLCPHISNATNARYRNRGRLLSIGPNSEFEWELP